MRCTVCPPAFPSLISSPPRSPFCYLGLRPPLLLSPDTHSHPQVRTLLIVLRLLHSVLARYSLALTFHCSWNSSLCSQASSTPWRPPSFSMLASRTKLSCLVAFLRSLRTSSVAKRGRVAGDEWGRVASVQAQAHQVAPCACHLQQERQGDTEGDAGERLQSWPAAPSCRAWSTYCAPCVPHLWQREGGWQVIVGDGSKCWPAAPSCHAQTASCAPSAPHLQRS